MRWLCDGQFHVVVMARLPAWVEMYGFKAEVPLFVRFVSMCKAGCPCLLGVS